MMHFSAHSLMLLPPRRRIIVGGLVGIFNFPGGGLFEMHFLEMAHEAMCRRKRLHVFLLSVTTLPKADELPVCRLTEGGEREERTEERMKERVGTKDEERKKRKNSNGKKRIERK